MSFYWCYMVTTGFVKMLIILIPCRVDNVTANEAQESSQLWNKSVHELSIKGETTETEVSTL